ncbi:hypothetical protein [Nonomuraea typhae]|uniref:hypothetical protein n=1 Tax=Nonomuraea typhae TaxID=2603600 RepID=UPI0012FB9ED6|nr:hypothetical protein [Nonomuraea typhae]
MARRVAYIVGIAVPVKEFRAALGEGLRVLRELRPGQVVVVADDPGLDVAGLPGVLWVRRDKPEHMDEGPGTRPGPS